MLAFVVTLLNGLDITVHPGGGSEPIPQLLYLNRGGTGSDVLLCLGKNKVAAPGTTLRMGDVTRLTQGMATPSLRKSGNEDDADCYVSLHTKRQTVDLQCADPDEADFMHAQFEELLKKPALLPAAVAQAIKEGHWKP